MDNELLTYEEFRVIAHDKVEAIVQHLLNFNESQEFTDMVNKFGEQYANELWGKMSSQDYAIQYDHVMRTSYEDYLKGFFILD